ncbi:MAG: hypothetical protein Q8Q10_02140 [bacterium]|nr:hypothetical protein [bacterium]
MKSNRKNGKAPRTTPYNFADVTAYAVAFYYLEVFDHLLTALYAKKVVPLHYRDVVKHIKDMTMPHTVEQRTVLINNEVEIFLERFSYPYYAQGAPKIRCSNWYVILVTVKDITHIHCQPDFEMVHITIPKQITGWLARNRSVPSNEVPKRLRNLIIPKTVLPSYRKAWEKCISDATMKVML